MQAACRETAPQYHRLLLDAYTSSILPTISEGEAFAPSSTSGGSAGGQQGQRGQQQQYHWPPAAAQPSQHQLPQKLQALPDDGYILINLGHHLMGSGRHHQVGVWVGLCVVRCPCSHAFPPAHSTHPFVCLPPCLQLRELLLDPDWLRRKLVAAGTTAVVADFRRWVAGVGRRAGGWASCLASSAMLPVYLAHSLLSVWLILCQAFSCPQTLLCAPQRANLELLLCCAAPSCCRYLLVDNCSDVKLVLEAFQLSAAQAVAYPRAPGLLRCLMAGRLATAPLSPALQVRVGSGWLDWADAGGVCSARRRLVLVRRIDAGLQGCLALA